MALEPKPDAKQAEKIESEVRGLEFRRKMALRKKQAKEEKEKLPAKSKSKKAKGASGGSGTATKAATETTGETEKSSAMRDGAKGEGRRKQGSPDGQRQPTASKSKGK